MTSLSSEAIQALCLLARRSKHYPANTPIHNQAWTAIRSADGRIMMAPDLRCLICNEECSAQIDEHGLVHLKEYNLLAFL